MADLVELEFRGDWRVVVTHKNAAWQQRVLAIGVEGGTRTLSGAVGLSIDVYGNDATPWKLKIKHNDGVQGWQDSWIRLSTSSIGPGMIQTVVQSEDITTPASDRDFDDLVIRLEKLGIVAAAANPFAVLPSTLQVMPEGIFEATFGRYFMGVRIRNVFTSDWPAGTSVGLTRRSRQWLAAAGVTVIDAWSTEDLAIFNQQMAGGRVVFDSQFNAWDYRTIYFKVDVSNAPPRKHQIELEATEPITHINKRARAPMMVSRTTFDTAQRVFVSRCDRGVLTCAVREVFADYNTLKQAVARARKLFRGGGGGGGNGSGGGGSGGPDSPECRAELERIRSELQRFLKGGEVDLCALWRRLQCICAGPCGGGGGRPGDGKGGEDTWGGKGATGLEFICIPSKLDYRVDYAAPFGGQHGPIPFDDPWWKLLLAIIAIILALGAAASAVADLANRSDDVVIGSVTRSVLDTTVDAAVATLNGNRSLSSAVFSYLDAKAGEDNTVPLVAPGGRIDTPGTTMSNAQIAALIVAFNASPADPTAQANVRVFKSGARTGLTFGRMQQVAAMSRDDDDDGVADRTFQNQVWIIQDPAMPNGVSDSGDSGSLWIHAATLQVVALNHAGDRGTNTAFGSRIADVMGTMQIRFA